MRSALSFGICCNVFSNSLVGFPLTPRTGCDCGCSSFPPKEWNTNRLPPTIINESFSMTAKLWLEARPGHTTPFHSCRRSRSSGVRDLPSKDAALTSSNNRTWSYFPSRKHSAILRYGATVTRLVLAAESTRESSRLSETLLSSGIEGCLTRSNSSMYWTSVSFRRIIRTGLDATTLSHWMVKISVGFVGKVFVDVGGP